MIYAWLPYSDEDGQRKLRLQLTQLEEEEQYIHPDFLALTEEEADRRTLDEYDKIMSFMFG